VIDVAAARGDLPGVGVRTAAERGGSVSISIGSAIGCGGWACWVGNVTGSRGPESTKNPAPTEVEEGQEHNESLVCGEVCSGQTICQSL
jgi:hypothetical protein